MSEAIIGYVEPLVAPAGSTIDVKISCSRESYTSQLFRLGPGVALPNGPAVKHTLIPAVPRQEHKGRPQYSSLGSYTVIPGWKESCLDSSTAIKISLWAYPTLPSTNHHQYLFSTLDHQRDQGFACLLNTHGFLEVLVGTGSTIQVYTSTIQLEASRWYKIDLELCPSTKSLVLTACTKAASLGAKPKGILFSTILHIMPVLPSKSKLVIASMEHMHGPSQHMPVNTCFNGKIDTFVISSKDEANTEILKLDFSIGISSDTITDTSPNKLHGFLVNAPTRAVPGHDWDGHENDWTKAKYGYGAIHFHDDDLDDSAWETDFSIALPKELPSGPYAVLVDDGKTHDYVTFFLSPKLSTTKKVVLVLSTFTYLAYANERLYDTSRAAHIAIPGSDSIHQGEHWHNIKDRTDIGISLYDSHNDRSGTVFSSGKRPLLNVRPDYVHWGFGGPRELAADLYFLPFLDQQLGENGYDIITDHHISINGPSALAPYSVILTNSHPEYPTFGMLESYSRFLEAGGHMMYLGGNGYYWVTAHDMSQPHRIEVRRGGQGCRSFELPAGEWVHSTTGETGGLWRARGRPPNLLMGLGSAACGMGDGCAYGIEPSARSNAQLAFVFKGLGPDENIIGDFGLINNAASGDEIDRLDFELGTPSHAVLLASTRLAGGHSDHYGIFNEEVMFPMINTMGTTCEKVRSDMIFYRTEAGGAVFSVGSINWVGSLAWGNYQNNVATITANVLREFCRNHTR